jgi:uncharacterized membrane protein YfcA
LWIAVGSGKLNQDAVPKIVQLGAINTKNSKHGLSLGGSFYCRCCRFMTWLLVLSIGLIAGTLAGVVGFGGTTILLPVLALTFGAKAAVPIMAIASIQANLSRVIVWWPEIKWPAVAAYSVTAIPGAWFGARTMLAIDPTSLEVLLGAFFIVMIPLRRWFVASGVRVSLIMLSAAGGIIGFLTGIFANTGPINTPFFLAHGLAKGAFIGTEAMSSLAMFSSKSLAFRAFGGLPWNIIVNGLIVGMSLMVGTWLAKRFVQRMSSDMFTGLMDVLLLITGVAMLVGALWHGRG